MQNLTEDKQEYYAKEVYKSGFSLELLENVKEGKTIQVPTSRPALPSLPTQKEESTESLPSLIKRIKPSTVIIFAYDDKKEFLQLGSGFFISQSGDIITNYHVLQGASSAEIQTSDGKTYPITYIVAEDEQSDIIRLSVDIPSKYVHSLPLSAIIPEVGERIIVYGSPLGLENTVSDGIVSSVREIIDYGKIIQITAPISPGSSGSPVLNMNGEVIGIATFQFVEGQNLNFAIPSERIANLILPKEKETFTTEELFGQEEKDKKDSDHAYEAADKALYFIDKKEYEKALPYLEIAIKTDISSLKAWAYFQMGFCYVKLKSSVKAMEAFKQVIRIDPDDADAFFYLGWLYNKKGNYEKTIEAYQEVIRINPDYTYIYYNLGWAYGELEKYQESVDAFEKAIEKSPEDADAHYGLGWAYSQLKDYEKAIEAFKQAIRIQPDYTYAHYSLGMIYLIQEDKNAALDEYKILKDLDQDIADRLFDMIYK